MNYIDETPPPRFQQAIAEFNARQFFECHETLEDLWNEEERDLRRFYQGILQIGVGYYKIIGKPNYRGALTLLQSGADMLEAFRPQLFGVDVEKLIAAARAARQEILELGADRYRNFDATKIPKIGLV